MQKWRLWSGVVIFVAVIAAICCFGIATRKHDAAAITSTYTEFRNAVIVGDRARALTYCRPGEYEYIGDRDYIFAGFGYIKTPSYALHANHQISFRGKRACLYPMDYSTGRTWEGMWFVFVKVGKNWYLTGETVIEAD